MVYIGRIIINNSNENLYVNKNGGKLENGFQWKYGKSEGKLGYCSLVLGNGKWYSDEYEFRKEFDDFMKF